MNSVPFGFTLADTPDVDPNEIPAKRDLLCTLIQASTFSHEENVNLALKFKVDASVEPPYNGREFDKVFRITNASQNNKYWMKQSLLDMGVPNDTINTWQTLDHFVQGLNQYVGRKFVVNATAKNPKGFQNYNVRQHVADAASLPTNGTTQAMTTYTPAPAAAPAAQPVVQAVPAPAEDPWANQAAQPAQAAPAPVQQTAPAEQVASAQANVEQLLNGTDLLSTT